MNAVYKIGGMEITQAELISVGMMIGAIALFIYSRKTNTLKSSLDETPTDATSS